MENAGLRGQARAKTQLFMKKTGKCKFTFIEKIKYYLLGIQSPSLIVGKCCYCERYDTCRYKMR